MAPPVSGDNFVWIGPVTGSWDTASNWEDLTAGDDPALVPPGALDTVTIASPEGETLTVTGTGNAAALALQGAIVIDADLTVGTLTNPADSGETPLITLDAGSIVDAVTAVLSNASVALGADLDVTSALAIGMLAAEGTITAGSATLTGLAAYEADLQIAGGLTLGTPSTAGTYHFIVDDGTEIQAGSLTVDGTLAVDVVSSLEVGTQGGAADGVVTIDAGSVVSLGGATPTMITANIVDDGTLILAPGQIDLAGLSGTGIVEVQAGATLSPGIISAGGLTIRLDKGASLPVDGLGAGDTVVLSGDNVLTLMSGAPVKGSISGFDDTDVIYGSVASATLQATGAGSASLTVGDLTVPVSGDDAGDRALVVPVGSVPILDGSEAVAEIVLLQPPTGGIAPGTATGNQYVWVGPLSGNWNDVANWRDVTTGANPAIVSPGSLDQVTIAGPSSSLYGVIGGYGKAASVTFTGNEAVAGTITAGTVSGSFILDYGTVVAGTANVGNVSLDGNSTLTVSGILVAGTITEGMFGVGNTSSVTAAAATMSSLSVVYGATAKISGLLDLGAGELGVSFHSVVQVGTLIAGGVAVDQYSAIEVGTANDPTTGALVIDPGGTLTVDKPGPSSTGVGGNIIDNGMITVEEGAGISIANTLAGTGTIVLSGDAALGLSYLTSSFSIGVTIALQGTDNTLAMLVGQQAAIRTTGFAAGDKIDIMYDSKVFPTYPTYTLNGTDLAVTSSGLTEHFYLFDAEPGLTFSVSADGGGIGYTLTAEAPCFCPGTLIQTDHGPVPVERLAIGDTVITLDGAAEPVRWIGRRSYAGSFIAGNVAILPVCIKAGALGEGVPLQDLFVSPGHAMFVDGQLVAASRLVNGVSIVQAGAVESVTYYHVELQRHAVLFANGATAESFLDDNCRNQFQNAASFYAAYPEASPVLPLAPRLEDGFALQSIQHRVAPRSGILPSVAPIGTLRGFVDQAVAGHVTGWAQDRDNPEEPVILEICVNGAPVLSLPANAYRADLRQGGLGSGCHAFDVMLDGSFAGPVTVRRMADGVTLPFTVAAGVALAA
jgi:hypothetical protein